MPPFGRCCTGHPLPSPTGSGCCWRLGGLAPRCADEPRAWLSPDGWRKWRRRGVGGCFCSGPRPVSRSRRRRRSRPVRLVSRWPAALLVPPTPATNRFCASLLVRPVRISCWWPMGTRPRTSGLPATSPTFASRSPWGWGAYSTTSRGGCRWLRPGCDERASNGSTGSCASRGAGGAS